MISNLGVYKEHIWASQFEFGEGRSGRFMVIFNKQNLLARIPVRKLVTRTSRNV